jgi:hypothetical protein
MSQHLVGGDYQSASPACQRRRKGFARKGGVIKIWNKISRIQSIAGTVDLRNSYVASVLIAGMKLIIVDD